MAAIPDTVRASDLYERFAPRIYGYCLNRLGRRGNLCLQLPESRQPCRRGPFLDRGYQLVRRPLRASRREDVREKLAVASLAQVAESLLKRRRGIEAQMFAPGRGVLAAPRSGVRGACDGLPHRARHRRRSRERSETGHR